MTSSSLPASLRLSGVVRDAVICDWLDVTCSPSDSFLERLDEWLCSIGVSVSSSGGGKTVYRLGEGTLVSSTSFNVHRASASGAFLAGLRSSGLFSKYLRILHCVPYKITRLDAALDVHTDAPRVLKGLCRLYGGSFSFGRKSLRTKTIFERRQSDDVESGTWYVGHKSSARVSCRVYDKQLERFNHGILIGPLTRYEITFRKDYGCSLLDAYMPKDLFYSHSSGLLPPPSGGFDDWVPNAPAPWSADAVDTDLTMDKFSKALEYSEELRYLARKGARFGDTGKALLMRRFESLLDGYIREELDQATTT